MINVGFVLPSSEYLHDPFRGDPHTQIYMLTHIKSRLKGVRPQLIDLRGVKKEFAIRHIPECDAYLHSVYTLDYDEQVEIVRNIRQNYPKAKHIAGGPHVSEFPDESLNVFDSIVLGEGEEEVIDAIDDFQNSGLKSRYEQSESIDINKYPFSLRKYLPKSSVARKNMMTLKSKPENAEIFGTTVLFSRGCPYSCSFCAMPSMKKFDRGTRYRTPELIRNEIEYLQREYGIGGINLLDEIGIPPSKAKAIPYLEAIASTGIMWRGQTRVDTMTSELAKLARESGCVALGLGVESASQTCLNAINKKIKVEDAKRTIRLLKEQGIETRVYMILGLPGETKDIVKQTWDFITETDPELVYLSLFAVRPGTEVYNDPEKFGIGKIETDWAKTMHLFGRYEFEKPTLTFEYKETTPWGRALTPEEIIGNYVELQARLREHQMSHI